MLDFLAQTWVVFTCLGLLFAFLFAGAWLENSIFNRFRDFYGLFYVIGVAMAVCVFLGIIHGDNVDNHNFDVRCASAHGIVVGNHDSCIKGKVLFNNG